MANLLITKLYDGSFSFVVDGDTVNTIINLRNDMTTVGNECHFKTSNGANLIKLQQILFNEVTVVDGATLPVATSPLDLRLKLISVGFWDWLFNAGSGVNRFDELLDTTPYFGNNGKIPVVNEAQLRLDYTNIPDTSYLDLFPKPLIALQALRVNSLATAYEFYEPDNIVTQFIRSGYTLTSPSEDVVKAALDLKANISDVVTPEWGNIGGILSNQTDLQNALDDIQDQIDFRNGVFSGSFDLTKPSNIFYSDYITGPLVNLSIGSSPVIGSVGTVRIKGNLLGTIPTSWNLSGQPTTNLTSKLNELTVLYVNDNDVRIVNRVVPYDDTVPPSIPINLHEISKTYDTINLAWDASTDDTAVTGYNVYLGGVFKMTTPTNNALITGLTELTTYSITVSAFDASGNQSVQSSPLSVTTPAFAYETEYQAVLDYATTNSFDLPGSAQQLIDNKKVKYLKHIGAWNSLDVVRIFNSTYSPSSWAKNFYRLNFKNPASFALTAVSGLEPSFTSGSGFNITGGSGRYAKTGFIPSMNATSYTGTNGSVIIGTFNIPSIFNTNVWITGGRSANNSDQILMGSSSNGLANYRTGSTNATYPIAQTDLNNHFHGYKSAGTCRLFKNGNIEITPTNLTGIGTGVPTVEQYLLAVNDNGVLLSSAMDVGLKYYLMGSALDTLKNEIYQILNETYTP